MELLIVNFHYFRSEKPKNGIYPVSHEELNAQIKKIAETYTFISQTELSDIITSGIKPVDRYCLITFDDGLKEQMDAYHQLKSQNIPAVFYVPSDPLEHNIVLDVHKLHYIRSIVDDDFLFEELDENFKIRYYSFDEAVVKNQYRYDNETAGRVKYFLNFVLNEEERKGIINRIFLDLIGEEKVFAKKYYMNTDDVRKLADDGALGSHGSSHLPLATLPFKEAEKDILHSIEYLQKITGKKIYSFSYPYGGRSAVSVSLAEIFHGTEVKFALTMLRGINNDTDLENAFFLKRIDTNDAPGGKLKSLEFV